MTDGYTVNPDALRADANQFFAEWKDDLIDMKDAVPTTLPSHYFSNIPGAQGVYAAYITAADKLATYIKDGSEQMDYFGRTLLTTSLIYMQAEGYSEQDIAAVKQELNDL